MPSSRDKPSWLESPQQCQREDAKRGGLNNASSLLLTPSPSPPLLQHVKMLIMIEAKLAGAGSNVGKPLEETLMGSGFTGLIVL